MTNYSYIHAADVQMIDNLYLEYKKDPQSIDPSWAMFFQGFDFASKSDAQKGSSSEVSSVQLQKELAVFLLILNYRKRGHLFANLNQISDENSY